MGNVLMGQKLYNMISRSTWKLVKVEPHYLQGRGPLFAYSVVVEKGGLFGTTIRIHLANDLAAGGALCSLFHGNTGYQCPMSDVTVDTDPGMAHITLNRVCIAEWGGDPGCTLFRIEVRDADLMRRMRTVQEFFE